MGLQNKFTLYNSLLKHKISRNRLNIIQEMKLSTLLISLALPYSIFGQDSKENDYTINEYILEKLEKFRKQMKNGVPNLDIPIMDPVKLPEIPWRSNAIWLQLNFLFRGLSMFGLSTFDVKFLRVNLEDFKIEMEVSFPKLKVFGFYNLEGRTFCFPFRRSDSVRFDINGAYLKCSGELALSSEGSLKMKDIKLDPSISNVEVLFKGLLRIRYLSRMANKMVNLYLAELLLSLERKYMPSIEKSVIENINKGLKKV